MNPRAQSGEQTNLPITNALMSLMCFHSSRFEARTDETGVIILYEDQDRNLWDDNLIEKGNQYLIESAKGQEISKYHLEASIAYWHSTKIENTNKWENILQLYNQLLQIEYSPIIALNRTYALSKVYGNEKAIKEAEKLQLTSNQFYFSLLGYLYTKLNNEKAKEFYFEALRISNTKKDKLLLQQKIKELK